MTRPVDDDRFELFAFWRTSAAFRVRVAFNLKGVRPRETFVDMDAGEQHGPAYRRISPLGGIPALIDHGPGQPPVPLTQSLAILEFLDELYPQPPLLPADAHGRARVRSIAQMLAADTHPLITPRVRQYLATVGGFDADAVRAWLAHWLDTGLRAVEQRLATEPGTGRFCHGDQPTMADICLASLFMVTRVLKIDVDGIPTATRIVDECGRLEAFAAAAPERQAGAPAA
ncbi:MAG TPA: maleylacetoacetate isomerase [Burkholderiaceae bacterium]|jgi:maleylacetoacetate isomerase/maleylpyruvate isomerase|nr:maleylacetoacetate isomerase [Burkholderiaceae bacterium]